MISLEHFDEIDMRVGTVTAVSLNKRARKPAYKITGKQVVCICNFEPIRIGDVKSEIRILGSDTDKGCIILTSVSPVKNGSKIY